MRYIRRIIVGLFILTLIVWILSTVAFKKNTDHKEPVITSKSDSIQLSVEDEQTALLQGLTAEDNKDGDITDQIIIGKQSKFVDLGTTTVQYLVFDSSNNVGTYERTVEYTDYTSPVFTLSKPLVYMVDTDVKVLDRIFAIDGIDGDISNKLKIISSDVDKTKAGVYTMGVQVSNRFGDVVTVDLPVNVVERNVGSKYLVLDSYLVTVSVGDSFTPEDYFTSVQLSDGTSISEEEKEITSNVDTSTPGTYQVLCTYPGGQTSLTVVVRE